jgi:hypothetical protein
MGISLQEGIGLAEQITGLPALARWSRRPDSMRFGRFARQADFAISKAQNQEILRRLFRCAAEQSRCACGAKMPWVFLENAKIVILFEYIKPSPSHLCRAAE